MADNRQRVLLVDDAQDVLDDLRASLEKAGMDVRTATDVKAAKEIFSSFIPHAVVIDYELRASDHGIDLLRYIRSQDKYVPVILFSAEADEKTKEDAVGLDIDFILEKGSMHPSVLVKVLQREMSKGEETLVALEQYVASNPKSAEIIISTASGESFSLPDAVSEMRRGTPRGRQLLEIYKTGVAGVVAATLRQSKKPEA